MKKQIKVLFQSRVDILTRPGGDTVQMKETAQALKKLGVSVKISTKLKPKLSNIDIVHIFNLDWVSEPYIQIKNAKKQGVKVVLSPIHHSLKEYKNYEKKYRFGLARLGNFIIQSQSLRDVARNVIKSLTNPKKIYPTVIQLFVGIRKQQKYCLEQADFVLVQTKLEASDLIKTYNPKKLIYKKIINGVNVKKFNNPNTKAAKELNLSNKYILSVGRIEPRKNQLSLIKAYNSLCKSKGDFKNYSLYFAGGFNNHHPTYVKQFKKELGKNKNIKHLGFLDQSVLAGVYKKASIFCVPSWFETTGLVYLEAVVAGCKSIVASGKRSKEYLKQNGVYCKPDSIKSIKKALIKAKKPTVRPSFVNQVKKHYTWSVVASDTLKVYKQVLDDRVV